MGVRCRHYRRGDRPARAHHRPGATGGVVPTNPHNGAPPQALRARWPLALGAALAVTCAAPTERVVVVTATPAATVVAATPPARAASPVVEHLQRAGLPIASSRAFTAETDPNRLLGRPAQY